MLSARLRRPVSCLALAAFLLANWVAVAHADLPNANCCCHHEGSNQEHFGTTREANELACAQPAWIQAARGDANAERHCPCHDDGAPVCPSPGGCMFCSIAKVPCVLSMSSPGSDAATVVGRVVDSSPVFFSLLCGEFFRPPRC
jgi:hypothetical protein